MTRRAFGPPRVTTGFGCLFCAGVFALALLMAPIAASADADANAELKFHPIAAKGGKPVSPNRAESDTKCGAIWGIPPTSAKSGYVVVVTGEIRSEPFRLWFFTPRLIEPGAQIELEEEDPGQLTVGSPPRSP